MSDLSISQVVEKHRLFFQTGATLGYEFRLAALCAMQGALRALEKEILAALKADLGKSPGEAYMTEFGLVLKELSFMRHNLAGFMKPRSVRTPLHALPASSFVMPEPYGVVLSISPWNYPFQLALIPLIDAVAAGNCVMLKLSSKTPHTAEVIKKLVRRAFVSSHVSVVESGINAREQMLNEHFDFIFYTGSSKIGKVVMQAAARQLTPVCLELGGKSPAIVWADADLEQAARKIAWGKMLNAGQTCIAPDYVLAQREIKGQLAELLQKEFERFPGPDALTNQEYAQIVNEDALVRLAGLSAGRAKFSLETRRMLPLVMSDAKFCDPVMQEEIFGPLLPVLEFDTTDELIKFMCGRDKPLACYLFSNNQTELSRALSNLSFGGGCINDTMLHASSHHLPFGGVGASGMGRYHGKYGFDLFSNLKSVLHKKSWFDFSFRYLPVQASAFKWIRRFLG